MSNRPISKTKHSSRNTPKISVKGIGRLLLVPILAALKPKAARWLSDWVRRKSTGLVAMASAAVGGGAVAAEQYAAAIVAGVVALALFLLELAASWALHVAENEREDEEELEKEMAAIFEEDAEEIPRALPVSSPELTARERNGFAGLDLLAGIAGFAIIVAFVFAGCSCSSAPMVRAGEIGRDTLERVSGVVSIKYQGGEVCVCVGVRDLFGGRDVARIETERAAEVPATAK